MTRSEKIVKSILEETNTFIKSVLRNIYIVFISVVIILPVLLLLLVSGVGPFTTTVVHVFVSILANGWAMRCFTCMEFHYMCPFA